jgi:hypothetical protein
MLQNDRVYDGVFDTMRKMSFNAIDISLLPSLHDRLLQRVVQFEPLLAMATCGLCMDVPVVSILSIKQFLDGQYVEDRGDFELLRTFCNSCWTKNMFLNKNSFHGDYGHFGETPMPYVTSEGSWADFSSILREKCSVPNDKKPVDIDMASTLCKKLYDKNQKALKTSAFCKTQQSFQLCIKSLFTAYDLRGFFGGMSKYHNSKYEALKPRTKRIQIITNL